MSVWSVAGCANALFFVPIEGLCVDIKDIKFDEIVGRGSFATVRHGRWQGRDVALKRIRLPNGASISNANVPKEVEIVRCDN